MATDQGIGDIHTACEIVECDVKEGGKVIVIAAEHIECVKLLAAQLAGRQAVRMMLEKAQKENGLARRQQTDCHPSPFVRRCIQGAQPRENGQQSRL